MRNHNPRKHSTGKNLIITLLCAIGAVLAAFIGLFTFLGTKAKKKRKTCKDKGNPLERESLRDEF